MRKIYLILVLFSPLAVVNAEPPASPARQEQVAAKGRHVMPFDLEKTRHVFDKTSYGGVQQVLAKDGNDSEQIALIRRHLKDISERMQQGDFSRQRQIHGDDMPGVAELARHHLSVHVSYRELPQGAEIEYAVEQSALVDAVHRYFNAQLRDHGRHAVAGHGASCQHKPHLHHGAHQPSSGE